MSGPLLATIDIGTNSILLLVVRRDEMGRLQRIEEQCEITRLGQGVAANKTLDNAARARSLAVLDAYGDMMNRLGVQQRAAIGTAVLRDAGNGEDFCRAAAEKLGCEIEVVSGEREAQLVLAGVEGSFGALDEPTLIFDVGGGSTELIAVAESHVERLCSLALGSVRLTEACLSADPPSEAELQAARERTRSLLDDAGRASFFAPRRVFGVAGTVTTLATVQLQLADYDSEKVNGLSLRRRQIQEMLDRFVGLTLQRRRKIVGLDPKRADVIIGGALIVDEIVSRSGGEQLTVCDRGVRWGLAHELARQTT